MSDILKHVVVGDLIGEQTHYFNLPDRVKGGLSFAGGFASHIILDLIDIDYTVNWFNPLHLRAARPFVLAQVAGILIVLHLALRHRMTNARQSNLRLLAIAGSVAPDIIDGIYSLLNPEVWYTGQLLFPWHRTRGHMFRTGMWPTLGGTLMIMFLRYCIPPIYRKIKKWSSRLEMLQ